MIWLYIDFLMFDFLVQMSSKIRHDTENVYTKNGIGARVGCLFIKFFVLKKAEDPNVVICWGPIGP